MFWFKKPQTPHFALAKHLPAVKQYIGERLNVKKPSKVDNTTRSASSAPAVSTTIEDTPHVQYSLRTPEVDYSQRDILEEMMAKKLRQQYMAWEPKQRSRSTFSSMILTHMARKQMDSQTFYRQAGIDRKLFSKIKTDFCYQPNKETALRCCLALHLDVGEALALLKSAGFTLSDSSSFDLAIRYCLANGICDLSSVNMLLEALDEKIFV